MRPIFELSATLRKTLVIVLMLFKSNQVFVQAVQRHQVLYLTARNGSISSPNYPKVYPTNIEWTWIIERSQHKVILEIKEMDLYRCYLVDPRYEDCENYDHVTITNYGIYCNGIKPQKIISFVPWSETIYITFTSLNSRKQCRGNGFKAYYKLVTEMPTTNPTAFVPTYSTEERHKTVGNSKAILEVTLPIVLGVILMVSILIVSAVWCCRKKASPTDRNARAIESRNRLLGLQIERHADSARRSRPEQDDSVRYSDIMLRNDIRTASIPLNYGPPPSYDEIGRDEHLNRSHDLEFPPSYETVMSESSAHA